MGTQTIAGTIDSLSSSASLFESDVEQDRFLADAIAEITAAVEVSLGAVFLYDASTEELVLRAARDETGLWDRDRCSIGSATTRLSVEGNHVGRAFREGQIVKLSYETDENKQGIRSKMIIPVAHGPVRLGVLVLADGNENAFDHCEDGQLYSLAARVADLLAATSALIPMESMMESDRIYGRRASEGIAVGKALPFWVEAVPPPPPQGSLEEETDRFDRALERGLAQLDELQSPSSPIADVGALIFQAHVLMLRDRGFSGKMRERILEGTGAVAAIRGVVEEYAAKFSKMREQRFAEKAQDVRDLGNRLIANLSIDDAAQFSYEGRIVLARHVYPSDLARLAAERVSGVVLLGAAVTAHISILARSLDIPVLITDDESLLSIPSEMQLLLDADTGVLIVDPSPEVLAEYRRQRDMQEAIPEFFTLRGRTADGHHVAVAANVNILKDAEDARRQGSEGIGLYRSEFPFILKDDFLSEEQQFSIYRAIVDTHRGKPVELRTADIGGDKLMQGRGNSEDNPFLGVRGIRFSLANREMFRDQLRAMLRAGAGADLGIMLPMVSGVEEVIEAKEEIRRASADLAARRVPFNENPRIGAMIELPSAALATAELARECDFLSIGTNDLTMYLLAVDRTNEALSGLYRTYHPSVLDVLEMIAIDAGDLRDKISVCGEAAADPVLSLFFVGIGIRKLSVSPSRIESLKARLAAVEHARTQEIAKDLLGLRRIAEMDDYLQQLEIEKHAGLHEK